MQYKVPQNVDIEDKVIGPLSLRQFMVILIATASIAVLNFIFVGYLRMVFWLLALIIGGLAGVLAFAKYGDQNAEVFLLSALKTLRSPRKRIWQKTVEVETEKKEEVKTVVTKSITPRNPNEARDDLRRLAQYVDTGGNIAIAEKDRGLMVTAPTTEGKESEDILEEAEKDNTSVDVLISKVEEKTPKKEPLLSEIASVSPNQQFDYAKIKTAKDGF